MGDEDRFCETIVDAFLEDIPPQIQTIDKLIENKDMESVVKHAHAIKGAAGNIGGMALSQVAVDMEKAARVGAVDVLETKN